ELVKKAGRASEMNRQKALKGIEAKRDLEMRAIGNFASNAESGGAPRRLAGALAWLTSNVSRGTGGASGGFSTGTGSAAANGTQRTLTENLVKNVLASAFANGGHPSQAYMGPAAKQSFSGISGIASIRKEVKGEEMATIIGAADVYVSDFGSLSLIPHPYGLTRDVLLLDPPMMAIGTLDGWKSEPLAKTGDSERFLLTAEKTLVVKNEKAHGVVADML